jgi:Tfp pilus assembly protein PilN
MTAVNLIPDAGRSGRLTLSTSPQTLALIAGLAAMLIAALLYVSAANNMTARNSELARVSTSAATWQTAASAFAPYVSESQQRAAQLAAVRQLAAARFPWPRLLGQIARVMPATAALSSLQAGTAAGGITSTTTSTPSTVQLSGCAASQSAVAQAMQQLGRVDGVSTVVLSSSTDNGSGGTTTGSASSATATSGGGSCSYPVQFQMSLTLTGAAGSPSAGTSTTAAAQ